MTRAVARVGVPHTCRMGISHTSPHTSSTLNRASHACSVELSEWVALWRLWAVGLGVGIGSGLWFALGLRLAFVLDLTYR